MSPYGEMGPGDRWDKVDGGTLSSMAFPVFDVGFEIATRKFHNMRSCLVDDAPE